MKITTYNPDGTVNGTRSIDIRIPENIKKYDEQNSFLNITADEVEAVNSRKNTFRKTLLLRRLTAAIKHDYTNFRNAYKVEADSLEVDVDVFMQEAESDPQIQAGDRIISSIMRIYGNRSRFHLAEVNIDEKTFLEQTCSEEEFLIYINKVEHQMTDENGTITSANWIKVIMYHAFKGAGTVKLKYGDVEEETCFYISLQNLINRYYYSLRNMERAAYWMPAGLKHQMYVLSAFVKKADARTIYRFDESRFFAKLINALYLMKEKQRSHLYIMAGTFLKYTPTLKYNGVNGILFEVVQDSEQEKQYSITHKLSFKDHNRRNAFTFKINNDEICALRITSINNNVLLILQSELVCLYNEFEKYRKDKWIDSVEMDAKIFFNKHKQQYESWSDFFYYEIEKYKYGISEKDMLKPQSSFYHLVCENVNPNERIGFSKDLIAGLIEIIIDYPDDNQEGLYECLFRMNYIKGMDATDVTKIAFNKAMSFIGRLFEEDCDIVIPCYKSSFKHLISQILRLDGIKTQLVKPAPTKNFKGGFNLSLVYNILGLLRKAAIIKGGRKAIDSEIHNYAVSKGLIDKKMEREVFLNQTTELGDKVKMVVSVIKKYTNSY